MLLPSMFACVHLIFSVLSLSSGGVSAVSEVRHVRTNGEHEAVHLDDGQGKYQEVNMHRALMRSVADSNPNPTTGQNPNPTTEQLDNLSAPIHVATWNKTKQQQCCSTTGQPIALDLFGGGGDGGMRTIKECQYACSVFPGCRFFQMDSTAEKDVCRGYPDCDHKCEVSWNKYSTLYLTTHEFATYDERAQEACCTEGGNIEYLDLQRDGNGSDFNVSAIQCEQACASYDGCQYWEHSNESEDFCYGYSSCDYLCMVVRGKPRTIFKELTNCDDFACPAGFLLKQQPARIVGNSVSLCCDVIPTLPPIVSSTFKWYRIGSSVADDYYIPTSDTTQ